MPDESQCVPEKPAELQRRYRRIPIPRCESREELKAWITDAMVRVFEKNETPKTQDSFLIHLADGLFEFQLPAENNMKMAVRMTMAGRVRSDDTSHPDDYVREMLVKALVMYAELRYYEPPSDDAEKDMRINKLRENARGLMSFAAATITADIANAASAGSPPNEETPLSELNNLNLNDSESAQEPAADTNSACPVCRDQNIECVMIKIRIPDFSDSDELRKYIKDVMIRVFEKEEQPKEGDDFFVHLLMNLFQFDLPREEAKKEWVARILAGSVVCEYGSFQEPLIDIMTIFAQSMYYLIFENEGEKEQKIKEARDKARELIDLFSKEGNQTEELDMIQFVELKNRWPKQDGDH